MSYTFYKYQGTGNDFVILDNRKDEIALTTKQIKHLCDRRFGIGADGLMLLSQLPGYDFEMKYYNADGNESSMCGNGGRCLVKFAYHTGIHKSLYRFMAIDGVHEATIEDNGWVKLKMKDVDHIEHHHGADIVNTGSPHYVRSVSNVRHFPVVQEGREIRYSKQFQQEGINVNFVQEMDNNTIYVRTYERGVEDETLSCGTGVTAAALIYAHNDFGFNRIEIQTPGGQLAVEFYKKNGSGFENIWLCGPAELVFEGKIQVIG